MFLQRYKLSQQLECSPRQQQSSTLRVGQLFKKITPIQIKQHMKQNIYINPRTSLIQNTKNLIQFQHEIKQSLKKKNQKRQILSIHEYHHNKNKFNRDSVQISSRETRMANAKKIRQRIWKSSDVTHLMKAHEQYMLRQKTANYHLMNDFAQNQQKIHRYQDMIALEEHNYSQRIMQETKNSYKAYNRKNTDRIQIQLSSQLDQSNPSNMANLQIKKVLRRHNRYHSVMKSGEKRANTTRRVNKLEDNFIQPW